MRPLLVLGFVSVSACGPGFASSRFEASIEEWTIDGNLDDRVPTYVETGGSPGGHICITDANNPADTVYFVAPPRYLGNVERQVYGARLTFDMKTSGQFMLLKGRDVLLNGSGLSAVLNLRDPPSLDWTPFSVRIDANNSGWLDDTPENRGQPASEELLRAILRNLNSLRIRAEYLMSSRSTTCLDNVAFGTP
ncbi:MAG: laminin B domain-containing protein [Myxococcaceae bacterium]|nr:laminin B domain-containing protein [Myxococcaceae bacterium]